MICLNCKTEMRKITTDYRYTESGLKNVILKGIDAYECPKCKEVSPIIKNIKEVHQFIAEKLVNKNSLLTGKEFAFLRKEMKVKAKDLAQIFGLHKVTISRWENEKEQIAPASDRLIRFLYDNRIFKQTCEIVRPGIDKLESQIMKSMLISLCEPKSSIEDVFRNIKRRHIHSKISIPISNLNFLARTLDSNLGVEFMEEETSIQTKQISSQLVTGADFKLEVAYGTAVGIGTTVGPTVGIGTTVDALTLPLSPPIIRPNKGEWASA